MALRLLILFLMIFLQFARAYSNENDLNGDTIPNDSSRGASSRKPLMENQYLKQSILPMALATSSLGILAFPTLKYRIQDRLNWNKTESVKLYDDELRYAPISAVTVLSAVGVKGRHSLMEEIIVGGFSYVLADFIVYRTKLATHVLRPAPSTDPTSFPSQHTSAAFVGATLLHREFGHLSPWISVAGYATATWVGISRIARNRHFITDVLMGAAVGTFSTNASYWAYEALAPKIKERFSLQPIVGPEGAEIQLSYNF